MFEVIKETHAPEALTYCDGVEHVILTFAQNRLNGHPTLETAKCDCDLSEAPPHPADD